MTDEKRRCIIKCLEEGQTQKETAHLCRVSLRDVSKINKTLEGEVSSERETNMTLFRTFADKKYFKDRWRPDLAAIVADTGYDPELVKEKYQTYVEMNVFDFSDLPEDIKLDLSFIVPCAQCGEKIRLDVTNEEDRELLIFGLKRTLARYFCGCECKDEFFKSSKWSQFLSKVVS